MDIADPSRQGLLGVAADRPGHRGGHGPVKRPHHPGGHGNDLLRSDPAHAASPTGLTEALRDKRRQGEQPPRRSDASRSSWPHLASADQNVQGCPSLGQPIGVGAFLVGVARVAGEVAGQPGQPGHETPRERRPPASLEDRPLDRLGHAVGRRSSGPDERLGRPEPADGPARRLPSGTPSRCRSDRPWLWHGAPPHNPCRTTPCGGHRVRLRCREHI